MPVDHPDERRLRRGGDPANLVGADQIGLGMKKVGRAKDQRQATLLGVVEHRGAGRDIAFCAPINLGRSAERLAAPEPLDDIGIARVGLLARLLLARDEQAVHAFP
ncbi:MAG: hypothetical protein NVS3B5_12040 [Sphingomicrobium sp.]